MFRLAEWNQKQKQLRSIILNNDNFDETIQRLSEMHSLLHTSGVYDIHTPTYMDEIWNGMNKETLSSMPTVNDVTVAWNIWHITRIEDLTAGFLIAKSGQVLDEIWLKRLSTRIKDTGNAMTDVEIISFSNEIDMNELKNYRDAVGKKTKEIIESLQYQDLKRKICKEQLNRISAEGGVLEHKDSIWLLDFWGKKTVAGIFLMPITRHQIVHLNDCLKLKEKCRKSLALKHPAL